MEQESNELTLTQRILIRATELIKVKDAWIRDDFFGYTHDPEHGYVTGTNNDKYCALGAIYRAASEVTGYSLNHDESYSDARWKVAAAPVIKRVALTIDPECGVVSEAGASEVVFTYNDEDAENQEAVVNVFCTALKEELGDGDRDTESTGS